MSWRRKQTATYWPQVPLYYSSTSSSFCWAAQPGTQALCLALALTTASCPQLQLELEVISACLELQLTQAVCGTWLYNCLTTTCFLRASHVHRTQPVHRSRRYSYILNRMHLFLDWPLDRGSICYNNTSFNRTKITGKQEW